MSVLSAELLLQDLVEAATRYLKALQCLKYPLLEMKETPSPEFDPDELVACFPNSLESLLSLAQHSLVTFSHARDKLAVDLVAGHMNTLAEPDSIQPYVEYLGALGASLSQLVKLKRSKEPIRLFLERCQRRMLKAGSPWPVETLMLSPEQVYPRYQKSLELLSSLDPSNQSILLALTNIKQQRDANALDTDLDRIVELRRVEAIQAQVRGRIDLGDFPRRLVCQSCYYLVERDTSSGKLKKPDTPVSRYISLFSDSLLISIPYRNGEAVVERFLPLESISFRPYTFEKYDNILELRTIGYQYYFATPSQSDRDFWVSVVPMLISDRRWRALSPTDCAFDSLEAYRSGNPVWSSVDAPGDTARPSSHSAESSVIRPMSGSAVGNQLVTTTQRAASGVSDSPQVPPVSMISSQKTSPIPKPTPLSESRPNLVRSITGPTLNGATHLVLHKIAVKEEDTWKSLVADEEIPYVVGVSGAIIGRAVSTRDGRGQIIILDDTMMSREHAEISFRAKEGVFTLRDLGSSNGTVINSGFIVKNGTKVPIDNKAIGIGPGTPSPWFRLALDFVFQLGGTKFRVMSLSITNNTLDAPPAQVRADAPAFFDGTRRNEMEMTIVAPDEFLHISQAIQAVQVFRVPLLIRTRSDLRDCGAITIPWTLTFDGLKRFIFEEQSQCVDANSIQLFVNGRTRVREHKLQLPVAASLDPYDQLVASLSHV